MLLQTKDMFFKIYLYKILEAQMQDRLQQEGSEFYEGIKA